tara:strand:+ start:14 stop:385 length:372 start_codon:yes stop_codon:yes gene_type:complete
MIIMENINNTERSPNKVYMVWKCPTHETNQRPANKDPRPGCGLIQYSCKPPLIEGGDGTQFNCKKCGKKPRMHPKHIMIERSKTPENLAFVKQYCIDRNSPSNDDILDEFGVSNKQELEAVLR